MGRTGKEYIRNTKGVSLPYGFPLSSGSFSVAMISTHQPKSVWISESRMDHFLCFPDQIHLTADAHDVFPYLGYYLCFIQPNI